MDEWHRSTYRILNRLCLLNHLVDFPYDLVGCAGKVVLKGVSVEVIGLECLLPDSVLSFCQCTQHIKFIADILDLV